MKKTILILILSVLSFARSFAQDSGPTMPPEPCDPQFPCCSECQQYPWPFNYLCTWICVSNCFSSTVPAYLQRNEDGSGYSNPLLVFGDFDYVTR